MENNTDMNQEQQETIQQEDGQQEAAKTYTQEEVDQMISKRLARERRGQPTTEELTEFREWKKTQKTPAEKEADAQEELKAARSDAETLKRENYLLRQGVSDEDLDYYAFKIGKLVTEDKDFETAAKEFLKEHKPDKKGSASVRVDFGSRLNSSNNGGRNTSSEQMNSLLRRAIGK